MATTLDALEQRLAALELEVQYLRDLIGGYPEETPAERGARVLRLAKASQPAANAALAKAFAQMGISGEPIGAEKVQEMIAACGIKPEDNEFSRGIIAMREEVSMVKVVYLDANAVAKRYVPEIGTPIVNYLFGKVVPRDMACLLLGALEIIAIFVRKKNAGRISVPAFHQALTDFKSEVLDSTEISKIAITDALVSAAVPLVIKHSLNATDAVILSSALEMARQLRAAGDDLVLVSADQRLLKAALADGLTTFNPETQTQTELDTLLAP